MEQESIYDWLWLLLVFGAGSRKIWKLLEQYETPQKVRQVLQTETDLLLFTSENNAAFVPSQMSKSEN